MISRRCMNVLPLNLLFLLFACNQGGQIIHVKKPSSGATDSSAHPPGRYDLNFKTQSTCTSNQGTWDSAENECYIMCMSPNTFDQASQKCIQGSSSPGDTKPEAGGRYDLSFKNENDCKTNQGLWDTTEKECYVICAAPNLFDQINKKCVLAANVTKPEAGNRYDLNFKSTSICSANQGTWDSAKNECYVICAPPLVFDQTNKKCVPLPNGGSGG